MYTDGYIWSHPDAVGDCGLTGVSVTGAGAYLWEGTDVPFSLIESYLFRLSGIKHDENEIVLYAYSGSAVEIGRCDTIADGGTDTDAESMNGNDYIISRPILMPKATGLYVMSLDITDTLRACYASGPLRTLERITKNPNGVTGFSYNQITLGGVTCTAPANDYTFSTPVEIVSSLSKDFILTSLTVRTYLTSTSISSEMESTVSICSGPAGSETEYVRVPTHTYLDAADSSATISATQVIHFPIGKKFNATDRLSAKVANNTDYAFMYRIIPIGYYLT